MNLRDSTSLVADLPDDCRQAAHMLNRGCACVTVDHQRLAAALAEGGEPLHPAIGESRPHLFADSMVFVADEHLQKMAAITAAIESVVGMQVYRVAALGRASAIARFEPRAAGVFMGYDFHLGEAGPQLIEINTNAGGGLLNAKLLGAQRACCGSVAGMQQRSADQVEADFLAMFRTEWELERGTAPLRRIAIVDVDPLAQYLAPEFELFRRLFIGAGIDAVIVDPSELEYVAGRLSHRGLPVDLVYNRLTDFSLDDPDNAALRAAYLDRAVVLTPHPHAHALYADKRNLVLLSDPDWLRAAGVPAATRAVLLAGIPRTVEVVGDQGEAFWRERKRWFFKPSAGFGSKAAYRGDKLTRRVFEEILAGAYVAQALVPPSERRLQRADIAHDLKLDLRNYVYRGRVQLVSARLYQGQTTNFRTPGGGFAAVFAVRCRAESLA